MKTNYNDTTSTSRQADQLKIMITGVQQRQRPKHPQQKHYMTATPATIHTYPTISTPTNSRRRLRAYRATRIAVAATMVIAVRATSRATAAAASWTTAAAAAAARASAATRAAMATATAPKAVAAVRANAARAVAATRSTTAFAGAFAGAFAAAFAAAATTFAAAVTFNGSFARNFGSTSNTRMPSGVACGIGAAERRRCGADVVALGQLVLGVARVAHRAIAEC